MGARGYANFRMFIFQLSNCNSFLYIPYDLSIINKRDKRMGDISVVFESAREAKAAKKALTEFFKQELELWNVVGCMEQSLAWHQDLEEVNEYVNSRKAQLERLGMGDRMISEMRSSQHGYSAILRYEIYVTSRMPKILIVGRTLRVEGRNITDKGVDKVIEILTDKGGVAR